LKTSDNALDFFKGRVYNIIKGWIRINLIKLINRKLTHVCWQKEW